jgi:hypothetical protein
MQPPPLPPITGTFSHPLIGVARAPAGVTGAGHLRPTTPGLEVVARSSPTGWMSAFGCLGAIVGIALAGGLSVVATRYGFDGRLGAFILLGCVLGGLAIGRKAAKEKPLQVTIAWDRIKDPEVIGPNLSFRSTQKPKGMVYFTSADQSALQYLLAAMRSGRMP